MLLSDENPLEHVTKTPSGAELPPSCVLVTFPHVFVRQKYMTMHD